MSDQVRALKDKATELTAKGKLPAAIDAWQKVLAAAPDELSAMQKVAELQAKDGRKADAVATYEALADRYAKAGHFFKASAVCRVVLSLDPGHQRIQEQIASLFSRAHAPKAPLVPPRPATAPAAAPPPAADFAPQVEVDIDFEFETQPPATASGLPAIPLFSSLTHDELKEVLASAMEVESLADGEVVVREGDAGDALYAVAEGQAGVFRNLGTPEKRRVASLVPGDIFGEVSIISGAPRVASVVAEGPALVLKISRGAMASVVLRYPRVKQALLQFYRERLLANALRASPLLRGLPEPEKRALTQAFKPCAFQGGASIITEGQAPGFVYLLLRGACAVAHQSGARYPDLREGDLFGEVSVLTGGAATATVRAEGQVLALRLPAEEFKARVLRDAAAAVAVQKLAAARLQRTRELDQATAGELVVVGAAELLEDARV